MADDSTLTKPSRNWGRFSLRALLVFLTLATLIVAWLKHDYERGIVNRWIDAVLTDVRATAGTFWLSSPVPNLVPCSRKISAVEQLRLLMAGARWLPEAERRTCVLKILAEQFPIEARGCFLEIARTTRYDDLKRQAILLACLYRNESDLKFFAGHLADANPEIRAAAIDAIGITGDPSFPIPAGFDNWFSEVLFNCEPLICLNPIMSEMAGTKSGTTLPHDEQFVWDGKPALILAPEIESRIRDMMLMDPDSRVREAAARAMLIRPAVPYQLRVAEWGVWINDGENLTLVDSILEEIPPFVHRSGDSVEAIKSERTSSMIIVTKPIIHLTVDQPMVVDLSVRIADGRPWFGYPLPDDYAVSGSTGQFGERQDLSPDVPAELGLSELPDTREGYPWILPSHTRHYILFVTGVGYRWQSLIVLPQRADWMKLEPVNDKMFQWWDRLRAVPSSWISSRGESERFLYYDGPTNRPAPIVASISEGEVHVRDTRMNFNRSHERVLVFIEVANGKIKAFDQVEEFGDKKTRTMKIIPPGTEGEAAVERLTGILADQGLTRDEAAGLVDCWRSQFFQAEGRRLLTILGKQEYAELCPLTVSPPPTGLARVGIVLTEFGMEEAKNGSQ